jgi:hypothetical protein
MADSRTKKQGRRVSGISDAALKGAKRGERSSKEGESNAAKLARPGPGATRKPSANTEPCELGTTNDRTGITGGLHQ